MLTSMITINQIDGLKKHDDRRISEIMFIAIQPRPKARGFPAIYGKFDLELEMKIPILCRLLDRIPTLY